ncbi:MAG TPA: hypothetical protein VM286_08600 [Candidatus Thermoplasmatota archaeon]|nr:hypothetical protein [Candidatus Thermoplasmatota archaeon]
MRAWSALPLLLMLVPLSGCTQGDTTTSTSDTFSTCPNWTVAQHPLAALADTQLHNPQTPGQTTRTSTDTFPFSNGHDPARAPADENGKKADRYNLRFPAQQAGATPIFVENGTLAFRVYRNDTNEQLSLYDPDHLGVSRMEWTFASAGPGKPFIGNANLQVDLVPATREPSPAAIRFEATFTANPGFVISSGAKGEPRVGAYYSVEPIVHYRAAGCLQK